MTGAARPFRLAVVAGEESGDLIGTDLVRALHARTGGGIDLIGVGGPHLSALGLKSLFDPEIIAIGGITAVLRDLPRLIALIGSTARRIAAAKPDCVVTIDSPAFNLRVARRIRSIDATIPVVHYVCPSIWAWLPGRAAKMKSAIDHVLCLLPFEPAELERLGGPPGTFVGHRLTASPELAAARAAQIARDGPSKIEKTLLLLPGSRRSEVRSLLAPFAETVSQLVARGSAPRVIVPTIPRLEAEILQRARELQLEARIVTSEAGKWEAFGEADVALAASGTVLLELAIAGVPALSCYKLDPAMKLAMPLITSWSAALPNLIADRPVVPEFYDRMVRPGYLAREIEMLWDEGAARQAQLEGYDLVRQALRTDVPAGEKSAEIVLGVAGRMPRSAA